ncbi:MAG TPA: hydantoinase B/oxoprolinase family protein [bacterium]|nr:hydantoinase B/oxoprolinase family protein [bacterium]
MNATKVTSMPVCNVPYQSGTHLNDVTLIMPVFAEGQDGGRARG